jgi:hypothetical protein
MYILRTKNRTTPRKAMTRMVTMAAMPPPDMPLDEPDAASALDAALEAEGVGVVVGNDWGRSGRSRNNRFVILVNPCDTIVVSGPAIYSVCVNTS